MLNSDSQIITPQIATPQLTIINHSSVILIFPALPGATSGLALSRQDDLIVDLTCLFVCNSKFPSTSLCHGHRSTCMATSGSGSVRRDDL